MTKVQVDELLMAINSLVDNSREWTPDQIAVHASAIQRMAANLPRLHETACSGWRSLQQLSVAYGALRSEDAALDVLDTLNA